jgi:imidazolonepropionase-like amidohydrolase
LNVKNAKEYWKTENKTPLLVSAISRGAYTIQNKVAANYYTTQTGFFCNQERALEKKTKIPLRVRLGSLSYTEQLEGY